MTPLETITTMFKVAGVTGFLIASVYALWIGAAIMGG